MQIFKDFRLLRRIGVKNSVALQLHSHTNFQGFLSPVKNSVALLWSGSHAELEGFLSLVKNLREEFCSSSDHVVIYPYSPNHI